MKKSVLILIMLAGCLLLGSCAVSADQMLQDFNGQIYEDVGGDYLSKKEPVFADDLIELKTYRALDNGVIRLEVSEGYYEYEWSLKDETTGKEYTFNDCCFIYIGYPIVKLEAGKKYTISLIVKNVNGYLFKDSATIIVV